MASTEATSRLQVMLGVHGAWGATPSLAVGGAARLGWRGQRWSIHAEARVDVAPVSSIENGASLGGTLVLGAALACLHRPPWFLCGNLSIGESRIQSIGLSSDRAWANTLALLTGGRIGYETPLRGALGLEFFVEVMAPLRSVDLVVSERVVWSTEPVSLRASVGLHWNL